MKEAAAKAIPRSGLFRNPITVSLHAESFPEKTISAAIKTKDQKIRFAKISPDGT